MKFTIKETVDLTNYLTDNNMTVKEWLVSLDDAELVDRFASLDESNIIEYLYFEVCRMEILRRMQLQMRGNANVVGALKVIADSVEAILTQVNL